MLTWCHPLAKVELWTRLFVLRWGVAGILERERIQSARTTGKFYTLFDGRWSKIVGLQSTLRELVGDQSEVTLRLVIP